MGGGLNLGFLRLRVVTRYEGVTMRDGIGDERLERLPFASVVLSTMAAHGCHAVLLIFQCVGVLQIAADVLLQIVDPAVVVAVDVALAAVFAVIEVGTAHVGEAYRGGVVGDVDGGGVFAQVQGAENVAVSDFVQRPATPFKRVDDAGLDLGLADAGRNRDWGGGLQWR